MNAVDYRNTPDLSPPSGAFSHACVVPIGSARLIFVSGQVPTDKDGNVVGAGDMTLQAEQVYRNIAATLADCGSTLADLVKTTVFVTDVSQRAQVGKVRNRLFPANAPTSTFVEVSALAHPDWLIEIEAVAVVSTQ